MDDQKTKTVTGMVKRWWFKPALYFCAVINLIDKRPSTHMWLSFKLLDYCYKEETVTVEDG